MSNLKPEEQARILIDEQLVRAGWHVCDRNQIELVNHAGTDGGPWAAHVCPNHCPNG